MYHFWILAVAYEVAWGYSTSGFLYRKRIPFEMENLVWTNTLAGKVINSLSFTKDFFKEILVSALCFKY